MFFRFFSLCLFLPLIIIQAQNNYTITGIVLDGEIGTPLPGANIIVSETGAGAASDLSGKFLINVNEPGSYTLVVKYVGYREVIKTDVIVRPSRVTEVIVQMYPVVYESNEVVVSDGYFEAESGVNISATGFTHEEIRRAPGSAGDVSRILMSLPSVAKINDQKNSLIVRGGSPTENAFFIDNIEIPNINHFPVQGSSGGPISLINVDFINDVKFYAGGFSPKYGNRLSSVMDISFREGSRESDEYQLDLNIAGFGGIAEGSIASGKGTYLISLRRSYLDLVVDMFETGTSVAPVYGDLQWKTTYDVSDKDKISFLGVWGDDHSSSDNENAIENDMIYYGNQDLLEGTAGLNWRRIWSENVVGNLSFAYTTERFNENYFETGTQSPLLDNNTKEDIFKARSSNFVRFDTQNSLEFGGDAVFRKSRYDNVYFATTGLDGEIIPRKNLNKNINSTYLAGYLNYIVTPTEMFTFNIGLRGDYYDNSGNFYLLPRVSATYRINPVWSFSAAYGWYSQNLPQILLGQLPDNFKIVEPEAIHYVLGTQYLLSSDTRINIEGYYKEYHNFPINPDLPGLFLIDEIYYNDGFFQNLPDISTEGKAESYGIELTLQKKLASGFYGLISGSWFRSKYTGLDGIVRNRVFDNQYTLSIDGGWKPDKEWELSARWILAGGAPYTPFNISRSESLNQPVLDMNNINGERYPLYHSLNVRVDKRFLFENSNIVMYLSIWNVYNRKNVANYFWNTAKNEEGTIYQWSLLPLFGIEYEF